jgi:ribosomal protein L7/L12
MNSQDLLEWVKENTPTGEARGHFAAAILFMFNKELCQANLHPPLNDSEKLELEQRNKLEAVKQYKRRTGATLIEAKQIAEDYMMLTYKVTHFNQLEREL